MNLKSKQLEYLASAMPIIFLLFSLTFYSLYSLSIGQPVMPYVNDPKDFFFGIPLFVSQALMIFSFAIFPFVVYLTIQKSKIHIGIYVFSMIILFAFFNSGVLQLGDWLGD